MRLDAVLMDEPAEHLGRAIGAVAHQLGGVDPTYFGTLNSPHAFGHPGLGSTWFWVDQAHGMVFVALTAGLMEESRSMERFQRLSDIALSSIVRP
jgi:CubicO group peptidase (beta-lactamase class C family)